MEEIRHGKCTKSVPPNTAQERLPSHNNDDNPRKRKVRDVDIHDSAYFKIFSLVRQLRPYFIEALKTPDFRNSKAAYEIRIRMKLVMDLYKQMQVEGNEIHNHESESSCQPLSSEKKLEREHLDGDLRKSPQMELSNNALSSEGKISGDTSPGSYIVGGSGCGWNFLTFANRNPPSYYGVTKESFRHIQSSSEKGNLCIGAANNLNEEKSPSSCKN